jgi:putative ABC transport system substrate-binding protein
MNKKIISLALGAMLFSLGLLAEAQQRGKIPRIGYMSQQSQAAESTRLEGFHAGLRDLGYVEEKNIAIEYRFADDKGDRLPDLAAELVRLKVNVMVGVGTQALQAAKQATTAIPIVFVGSTDPVALGLVASFARPGGNITGMTLGGPELYGKRLELLKETVPRLSRAAFLWNPANPAAHLALKETRASAQALGLQIQSLEVRGPNDIEDAFEAAIRARASALIVGQTPPMTTHRKQIVDLAVKSRLPAIYGQPEFVEDGGLMSYATNFRELWRRAAYYVDRILKGTKPADLPVEQPTKFELVINLKTAKQIGLTIPPNVLVRADKVIK